MGQAEMWNRCGVSTLFLYLNIPISLSCFGSIYLIKPQSQQLFYFILFRVHSLSSIGKIQAHDSVMRLQDRCVSCKVGRRAGVRLDVYPPQVWVQTEGGERSFLAEQLNLIYNLCPSIVPRKW